MPVSAETKFIAQTIVDQTNLAIAKWKDVPGALASSISTYYDDGEFGLRLYDEILKMWTEDELTLFIVLRAMQLC